MNGSTDMSMELLMNSDNPEKVGADDAAIYRIYDAL